MSRQNNFLATTREEDGKSLGLDHVVLGYNYANNSCEKELSLSEAEELLNDKNEKRSIFVFCRDETGKKRKFWVLGMKKNNDCFSLKVDFNGSVESLDFFPCVC